MIIPRSRISTGTSWAYRAVANGRRCCIAPTVSSIQVRKQISGRRISRLSLLLSLSLFLARVRHLPPRLASATPRFLLAYVAPWPLSLEDYGVGTCLSSPRVLSSSTRSRAPRHPSPLSHPPPSSPSLSLSHSSYLSRARSLSLSFILVVVCTSSTPRWLPSRSPPARTRDSRVEAPSKPHVRPTSHRTLHLSAISNSLPATSLSPLPSRLFSLAVCLSESFRVGVLLSGLLASNVNLSVVTFHTVNYILATRVV